MQLKIYMASLDRGLDEQDVELTVKSEYDIRAVGFAAARAVRSWLRHIPFVPLQSDLYFNIYAEVEQDEKPKREPPPTPDAAPPKRKKRVRK